MISRLLLLPITLLVFSVADAKEIVLYKFYEGDGQYSFVISDRNSCQPDPAVDFFISSHINSLQFTFNIDTIPKSLYSVLIDENIIFFGNKIKQYELIPVEKDRSKIVLWVDTNNTVIKAEAYDIDNRLMMAFANFTTDSSNKNNSKTNKRSFNSAVNTPFYKGFIHVRTNVMPLNVKHLLFTDKVNRFSLFIDENPRGITKSEQVVHGNNLLSKVVNGIEYAVVGTVTYEFMDKFIDDVASNKKAIDIELDKVRLLTADILSK